MSSFLGGGGGGSGGGAQTINTQTASYILALGDAQNIVEMNAASTNTLTVPANATVAFPIGTRILIVQVGAGQTTITGAGGVTLHNAGAISAQWDEAWIYQRATDEWVMTVG